MYLLCNCDDLPPARWPSSSQMLVQKCNNRGAVSVMQVQINTSGLTSLMKSVSICLAHCLSLFLLPSRSCWLTAGMAQACASRMLFRNPSDYRYSTNSVHPRQVACCEEHMRRGDQGEPVGIRVLQLRGSSRGLGIR